MQLASKLLIADIYSVSVLVFTLPAVVVFGFAERRGWCYGTTPTLAAQIKGFLFQVVGILVGVPITYLLSYWLPRPSPVWPTLAFPIALVISDFIQYWEHRIEHWLFWRVHAVHHSTREMTATSNINHFAHNALMAVIYGLPMAAICGDPMASIYVVIPVYWWTALTHSPAKINIGPLRWVLVDNRMHRIHHSIEKHHWDRNFGVILTIWDFLFGTIYWPKEDEWPQAGVAGQSEITSVSAFLLRPFRQNLN